MDLARYQDLIAKCNRCGFCQVACPIFRSTGHEAGVARGRLALVRALVEGRIAWSPAIEEPLFTCLLCGACTSNCFPALPTADILVAARSRYLEEVRRSFVHRLLFDHLLPHPGRLRLAARGAAFGKRSGLSRTAQALGLLRIFGRDFPRAADIVESFPRKALRDRAGAGPLAGRGDNLRVAYFVGCGMDIMSPDAAEATLDLLRATASEVTVLPNCCCGLPAETYGDRPAARRLAAKNLAIPGLSSFDAIVTDCSSCASFLKKYPTLFDAGDALRPAAEAMAARVRDAVEAIAAPAPPPERREKLVVTYHDPCHASRGQKLAAEPRRLLRSLPGIEYRELPEADWCCGGAGSYALSHYELSRRVLDRKIRNVEKTGASVLATSCPACIIHLAHGVRLRGLPVRVCHISELLAGRGDGDADGARRA